MKPALVFDTTISGVSIAFIDHDGHVTFRSNREHYGSAQFLPLLAAEVLEEKGVAVQQLQGVVLSPGPGSFTGIKVGLAYGMGLAGEECRLYECSALFAAFTRMKRKDDNIDMLTIAQTKTHGFAVSSEGERLLATDQLWESKAGEVVVGGKWDGLKEILDNHQQGYRVIEIEDVCQAAIEEMVKMYLDNSLEPVKNLRPNYLRLSTAEERLATRGRHD